MLEQKDLDILQEMIKNIVDSSMTESEKRMESAIENKIAESEKRMESAIENKIAESEKRMESVIDTRISESENLVLKELDRIQISLESKINAVQKNLDELNQYYRITKLENDNTALLLKMINELSKRVEELEKKTA